MPATTAPPIMPIAIINLIGRVFVQRGKMLRISAFRSVGRDQVERGKRLDKNDSLSIKPAGFPDNIKISKGILLIKLNANY